MREELLAKKDGEIRGMFGRIAPRYDFLNRVLSLGRDVSWRRTVARRGTAAGGSKVLDVCTGTGDLAQAFALTLLDQTQLASLDIRLVRYRIPDVRTVPQVVASLAADGRAQFPQPNYLYSPQAAPTAAA